MKNIVVSGCGGKMGRTLCNYLGSLAEYRLVAGVDPKFAGQPLRSIAQVETESKIFANINEALKEGGIDVAIDFTAPFSVVANAIACLNAKVPVLIGTTGISQENQNMLDELAKENKVSIMIVPNFAIGAILMMSFAKTAAKFMKKAEIIELHHDTKLDKPSGTAIRTRKLMLESAGKLSDESKEEVFPIHSVRLPGLVAHQEVIFGDLAQSLSIRHDTTGRESFMPGVAMALSQMGTFVGLRTGLDLA